MVLVLGGVGVAVGSVCVDAARGEWRSTYDVRRAMRRATRGARWVDQERAYVGTTCKVEETTRGSPGGETGEKEKDGNMQEERRKAGEKARQRGDQQEATTAAVSIGMLAFGGVGHRRIMARAFSR